MASIDPNRNTGVTQQTVIAEPLIPTQDTSSPTLVPGPVNGVEDSVSDIGIPTNQTQQPIIDFSLPTGTNTDVVEPGDTPFGSPDSLELPNGDFSRFSRQVDIGVLLEQTPISALTNVAPQLNPVRNVLHEYATHTYRITLGAQSLKDHNEITENGFTRGTPKITTMMMQSGGGFEVDGVCRDHIFKEDFYLGNLNMTTLIG